MRRGHDRDAKQGFTLIELLLVVAILGILAAIVVAKFSGRSVDAMIKATRTSIANVGTAIDMYEVDTGRLPSSLNNLTSPSGEPNWNGPYLKGGAPADSWGTPLIYSSQNAKSYELRSAGPDTQAGNEDDITGFIN